ncbi:hypothetical protein [Dactylosporangium sp. NPDC051484]|uniref:hypothetical protein n=1 Tax=Dactylosporangium sp. NPDC051484 TaxID=3154942 RepID=UPI00344CA97C
MIFLGGGDCQDAGGRAHAASLSSHVCAITVATRHIRSTCSLVTPPEISSSCPLHASRPGDGDGLAQLATMIGV